MSNAYKYVDPDYTYIDSSSGLLKNIPGISNAEVLLFIESGAVTKRLNELYENPIRITSVSELFLIHKLLFQDIYEWAGKERVVEISKDGKQFFPTSSFQTAYRYIDELIKEYNRIPKYRYKELAYKLAEILDNVNYLHPFREGNGRVQREFIRLLALNKGLTINLNPIDDASVYERYMEGTINSNLPVLSDLIHELIIKSN